jgi:hypothetical protein
VNGFEVFGSGEDATGLKRSEGNVRSDYSYHSEVAGRERM